MAFRRLSVLLFVLCLAAPHAAQARVPVADLGQLEEVSAAQEVKGGKRLNIRPAPRQRATPGKRLQRPGLNRAPQRQLTKRAAPRVQRAAPPALRRTGVTGRKALPARAAAKPLKAPQIRQRLGQIRKALPSRKAAAPKRAAAPKAAKVAKPLTKARLDGVRNSLKTDAKKIRYDKSLSGHKPIGTGAKAYDQVPQKYRQSVKDSFKGEVRAIKLTRPMVVQRRYGGTSAESGSPYFSRQSYGSRLLAKARLALPRGNKANLKTTHVIPKGAVILVGRTAGQKPGKTFGVTARGGGEQIYVVKPSAVKSLKMTGGLRP